VIQSRRMKGAGHVESMGEIGMCIPPLCGEPKGKGPHGRHRLRWEENIKMNVQEVGWRGMSWFDLG
jgi:hypothetical protein